MRSLFTLLLLWLLFVPVAASADIESAKAAGEVGERFDGYLGIVDDKSSAATRAMVEEVNAERRSEYEDIAKQNGVAVEQVAALSGKKLIQRTPSGQYIMPTRGRWVEKR